MATLAQIRTRVLQRTDNEHTDGFVDSSLGGEVDGLINQHAAELHEILVLAGVNKPETEFAIAANGAASYALPTMYGIRAVFRVLDDGIGRVYLPRHDHRDSASANNTAPACTYRVVNNSNIEFIPRPSGGNYVVVYVPRWVDLVADTGVLDGVAGWEEYVVVAAALDIAVKESVDLGLIKVLEGQMARQQARVRRAIRQVDLSEAPKVADVRGRNLDWPEMRLRNIAPVSSVWWWGRF